MATANTNRPRCQSCESSAIAIKWGKDRAGNQRWRCKGCGSTWSDVPARPLGSMRLSLDRVVLVLSLLSEGMSIRSTERVTGHHRDTISKALRLAGDRCADLLDRMIADVEVSDVQCDEIWGFVGMKQKTKNLKKLDNQYLGDAWCWTAIDRDSKLILTHRLGSRTAQHADSFCEQLDRATVGRFQLSTDGLDSYPEAVSYHLGTRVDYGQIIKEYGSPTKEEQRRYSPARIISVEKRAISGSPDEGRICTSHVERSNLTIRTHMKRMTRLTCAFSKKWENLRAAFGLHFACYNLVKSHRSIRMTPAMKAGLTSNPWSMADLVAALA